MILGAAIGAAVTYQILSDRPRDERLEDMYAPQLDYPQATSGPSEFGAPPAVRIPKDELPPIVRTQPNILLPDIRNADSFAAAFAAAMAVPDQIAKSQELRFVAEDWVVDSPDEAFAALDQITDRRMRQAYLTALVSTLMLSDPELTLRYVLAMPNSNELGVAVREMMGDAVAFGDPVRLLAVLDESSDPRLTGLSMQVLSQWSQTDPLAALNYAEALPNGQQQQMALRMGLRSYAASDPEAALAWLESSGRSSSAELRATVINGIAEADPLRALEMILAATTDGNSVGGMRQEFMGVAATIGRSGGAARALAAERLMNEGFDTMLPILLSMWAQDDASGVMQWLGANTAGLSVQSLGQLAQIVGQQQPALAAEFTPRVPEAARGAWIAAVAQSYARDDPDAAMNWLRQYQSQDGYAAGVAAIAQARAIYDPPAAAALLDSVDTNTQYGQVAAAAVATTWAQRDVDAAVNWVTNMPPGAARDMAIGSLTSNAPGANVDDALLQLVSNDMMRTQIISGVIARTAATDPDGARDLMNQYITDPSMRERLELAIENSGNFGVIDGGFPTIIQRGFVPGSAPIPIR